MSKILIKSLKKNLILISIPFFFCLKIICTFEIYYWNDDDDDDDGFAIGYWIDIFFPDCHQNIFILSIQYNTYCILSIMTNTDMVCTLLDYKYR